MEAPFQYQVFEYSGCSRMNLVKHINSGLPCGVSFEESELDDEEAVAEAWKIFQAGSTMARGGVPYVFMEKKIL